MPNPTVTYLAVEWLACFLGRGQKVVTGKGERGVCDGKVHTRSFCIQFRSASVFFAVRAGRYEDRSALFFALTFQLFLTPANVDGTNGGRTRWQKVGKEIVCRRAVTFSA